LPVLSVRKIPVAARKNPTSLQKVCEEVVREITDKIFPKQWYTLFSNQSTLSNLQIDDRSLFIIPEASSPHELLCATNMAKSYFTKYFELLEMKHPEFQDRAAAPFHFRTLLRKKMALEEFDLEDPEIAEEWAKACRKPKMLVHICCGPDAAGVIQQLKNDYELLCFWYDPIIQPKEEYDRRLEAFERVAQKEQVEMIVGEYDVERFLENIRGLEKSVEQGAKCSKCYDMRIERAAVEAKARDCDFFTSSLAISPHKVQEKLKNFGGLYGDKYGVPYFARNFMKDEGFKSSVEYSKDYDIYRQDYCGCWFSLHEGGKKAQEQAKEWGFTREDLEKGHWKIPN